MHMYIYINNNSISMAMALFCYYQPSFPQTPSFFPLSKPRLIPSKSSLSEKKNPKPAAATARPENIFQPSVWHYDYIQSLTSDYSEESPYSEERERLIREVGLEISADSARKLELVDVVQRLGVARHFSAEIGKALDKAYSDTMEGGNYTYATALGFRLLRQYNYCVSSEILKGFEESLEREDIKRVLWLYEASFHSMEGEMILEEAREASSRILKRFVERNKEGEGEGEEMLELVKHAMEVPLHWRTPRIEARWFIHYYGGTHNMHPSLLRLAVLDFNMLQLRHQHDLKHVSRWWKAIGFVEKLSFGRDRLVENFLWTVGLACEPQFGEMRRTITKVNALITAVDDIYDAYATLPELELFTQVVHRWDVDEVDILPEYMKICFLEIYALVNEAASASLKENGVNIFPKLKKVWTDLCKSYFKEAKWYDGGYRPRFREYMENAWVSIGAQVILVHVYYLLQNSTRAERSAADLEEHHEIIHLSAMILRLANDLGTSKMEKEGGGGGGDVAKAVECYMNESRASKADAQMHINSLINTAWKKMNKEAVSCSSKSFIEISMNLARMSLFMYQHGDGHTSQYPHTKNHVIPLLFEHVDIPV